MSRDWKPGDVVTATVKGRENVRLVAGWSKYAPRLRWCEMSPRWGDGDDDACWFFPHDVTDARPLVAIDLAQTIGGAFLPDWLRHHAAEIAKDSAGGRASVADDMCYLADQIEAVANPRPPKPEEPTGLGAVVEDADGTLWFRMSLENQTWPGEVWQEQYGEADRWSKWASIAVVRVLSEGVQS